MIFDLRFMIGQLTETVGAFFKTINHQSSIINVS